MFEIGLIVLWATVTIALAVDTYQEIKYKHVYEQIVEEKLRRW